MNRLTQSLRLLVSSSLAAALCVPIFAVPVWTGLAEDDDNWSNAANWSDNTAPVSSTSLELQFDGTGRSAPYIDVPWTLKSLTFNTDAQSFSLSGGTLTFAIDAAITNNSSTTQVISNNGIVLNGASTWNTANSDFEIGSAISGAGSITKSGDGTLLLSGTNTYSGTTTISAGVLDFGTGGLGSSAITINGGQLRWGEGNTDALSGAITLGTNGGILNTNGNDVALTASLTGAGAFTKIGSGILTLNTPGNSTGSTTVTGGTLRLGAAGALPASKALTINSADADGATFDLNGQNLTVSSLTFGGVDEAPNAVNAVSTGSGTLTLARDVTYGAGQISGAASISGKLALGGTGTTRTFTINDSTNTNTELTISAVISGTGGLTKAGDGTLVLSGTNTYTGVTLITGGALRISSLPTTSKVQLNGGVIELASDLTLTNGTQAGQIQFTGSGGFSAFGGDRIITYQGNAAITWGTAFVAINKSLMLSSRSSDSMVTLSNNIALGATGNRTVDVANGSADIDATLSGVLSGNGSLIKVGDGTLRLSGANTYTTKTTISEGTLLFAKVASFHNGMTTNWTVAKFIVSGGATAAFNVGGTGEFTSGNIDTLKALGTDDGGFRGGSSLGLDTTNATGTFTYASVLADTNDGANALGFAKLGTGTLSLTGNNTYTGGTSLRGGTLNLGSANAIGSDGLISFLGGTLQFSAANTTDYSSRFSNDEGQRYNIDTNGQSVTFESALNAVDSTLTKLGTGTLTLSGSTSNDGLTLVVNAGTVVLAKDSSSEDGAEVHAVDFGLTVKSGGTVQLGGTGGDQLHRGIIVALNSGGTFDFNGRDEAIGALNGDGTVTNTAASTTSTFTIGEDGENDSTFSGILQDGAGVLAVNHISSGTLTLSGANTYTGGTTLSDDGTVSLGSAGALGSTGTITLNGGTLQFTAANTTDYSARFSTEAEQHYNIDTNGQSVTLASDLSSDGGTLIKLGDGKLTLSGANSYTGDTDIWAGTLSIANDLGLGTTDGVTTVLTGATLEVNNAAIGQERIYLDGSGVGGNGTLVGKGVSSIDGDIDLLDNVVVNVASAGMLSLNGSVMNNPMTKIGDGTLVLGGETDNSALSVILNAGTLVLAKDSSEEVHAVGGAGLTINSGATAQLAGTGDDQLQYGVTVDVNSGGTFDLNGRNEGFTRLIGTGTVTNTAADSTSTLKLGEGDSEENFTFDGVLQDGDGILALEKLGTDALTFTLTGANTYTGGTTLSGGILSLGSAGAIGSEGTITFNGGILQFTAANTTDYSARFSSETGQQYKIDTNGESVTFASEINSPEGYLQKLGAGTLTLSAANNIDGRIDITEGTLKITDDSALGATGGDAATYISDGATLALDNVNSAEIISATGNGVGDNGAIVVTTTSTLSGEVLLTGSSSIGVAAGQSLHITGIVETDENPDAALTKIGSGTLVLSGDNTYTGQTFVNAGTLLVNGTNDTSLLTTVASGATLGGNGVIGSTVILAGGTLAPGHSTGPLTVNGDLTFQAGSVADFQIGGLVRGSGYDAVDISGVFTAGGTLNVSFSDGFTPTGSATFELFNFISGSGSFGEVNLPDVVGYTWDTSSLGIDGTISLVASAIPESGTYAVLAGLAVGVFAFHRRRRARAGS